MAEHRKTTESEQKINNKFSIACNNNNIYTVNGFGYLEWKKEQVLDVKPTFDATANQDFDFTGAFLYSLFNFFII